MLAYGGKQWHNFKGGVMIFNTITNKRQMVSKKIGGCKSSNFTRFLRFVHTMYGVYAILSFKLGVTKELS